MERVEVAVHSVVKSRVVREGCALRLRATMELKDHKGVKRVSGERWLVREEGHYLPRLFEVVEDVVKGVVITHK